MKKKKIIKLLATSAIVVNCTGVMVNAQTDKNIQNYNVSTSQSRTSENVTLSSGKQIRTTVTSSGEVVIEEADTLNVDKWSFVDNIGKAVVKSIADNSQGGYTITYLKGNLKYTRGYDKDSSKVEDEKLVGVEVLNYYDEVLKLDLSVDENNYETTIITPNGKEVIKDFIPTLAENLGDVNISMIGKGKDNNTSVIVVTKNKKIIQSKDIAEILGDKYSEVRAVGGVEVDEERFIISGYAVRASDSSKRDGFVIQFDGEGNRDNTDIKIIPATEANNYDASIKIVIKFDNGNLLLKGDNLGSMYINALDYNDPRIVKESLKLSGGKTYEVVESEIMTLAENKTYTVKCIDGDFEYDIATYKNIKDIKLVPGNDDQVLIAVQKDNDTTEIGVINSKANIKLDENGEAIGMVSKPAVIQDASGPILNIDINKIKVDASGQVVVNKNGESDSQQVTLDGVKPGDPVEVTPNVPTIPDTPQLPPTTDGDVVQSPSGDEGAEKPETGEEVKPNPPSGDEETVVKPENNSQVVNIDNGEKVTFDMANPNNIKIVSNKLANKEVNYIVVNGVKITKPSMERLIVNDTLVDYNNEYYTVEDGGIVLLAKLFETLKLDSNRGYDISVAFNNGEEIENLTRINVIDTSNTVEIPEVDSETMVTNPVTNNSTVNKEENSDNENIEVVSEKAPKTGVSAKGLSLIVTMMSSAVGAVLSRKKK